MEAIRAIGEDYEMGYLFGELDEAPCSPAACSRCGLVALDGGSLSGGKLVCSDCDEGSVFPV